MKWDLVYVSKTLGENIRVTRAGSLLKWLVRTFQEPRHEYVVLHANKGGKLNDDEMINLVTSFIKLADSKHKDYFKDSDVETWKNYLREALEKLEGIGDTGYLVARYKGLDNSEFLRKFYFIKTEFTKNGEEVSTEIPKFSKDRTLNITSYVYSPYEKFDIEYNVKLKRDMSIATDSKTGKETRYFFDDLIAIKEQLFDAPVEVKESFNALVNWFDENNISPKILKFANYVLPFARETFLGQYDAYVAIKNNSINIENHRLALAALSKAAEERMNKSLVDRLNREGLYWRDYLGLQAYEDYKKFKDDFIKANKHLDYSISAKIAKELEKKEVKNIGRELAAKDNPELKEKILRNDSKVNLGDKWVVIYPERPGSAPTQIGEEYDTEEEARSKVGDILLKNNYKLFKIVKLKDAKSQGKKSLDKFLKDN